MSTTTQLADDLQDHGIAVKKGVCLGISTHRDAETGKDYVYAGLTAYPSMILQLDVATGKTRAFRMPPPTGGPWGIEYTMEGHVLVTSTCGRLARLNPKTGEFIVATDTKHWMWTVTRGADGKFYMGTSKQCRLFLYDAVTGTQEDLGPVSPHEHMLRQVVGGSDGYIYCSVGSVKSQIVAYHIGTKRITPLLPKSEEGPGTQQTMALTTGGQIFAKSIHGNIYRLSHGEAFFDKELTRKSQAQPGVFWEQELAARRLADGRRVELVDLDKIRITDGRKSKLIPFDYETDGTQIFHVAPGPDKTVYASTIYPQHNLRYVPARKKLEGLGRGGPDRAEAYSIGHCDGKVYYGTYSTAKLLVYDPAKPLHRDPPGEQKWKTNPKLLGYLGKGNCRPQAMTIDSQKRVWVGGVPEYGYRHGGLACYDIRKAKLTVFDEVTPDQSVNSLAADETGNILYGGTSIERGAGYNPVARESHLFAWDTRKKKTLWKESFVPGMTNINNLLLRDGKLYGTTTGKGANRFNLFRFDIATRKPDYVIALEISGVRGHCLQFAPDGWIYGITWMVMFRWRPADGKIEELYRCVGDDAKNFSGGSLFHLGAVPIDGRIYFSCGAHVMSLRVPPAAD